MRLPPAKDPVQRRPVPAHQRLWSDASTLKLASLGTCRISMPVFRFQLKILRLAYSVRKLDSSTNSLLHRQFPFMLINNRRQGQRLTLLEPGFNDPWMALRPVSLVSCARACAPTKSVSLGRNPA